MLPSPALLVEPFKRLWTPSFARVAGALGRAIFLVAFAVSDVALQRTLSRSTQDRVGWPLVALSRNSLLLYFGSHLVSAMLLRVGDPSVTERIGGMFSWPASDPPQPVLRCAWPEFRHAGPPSRGSHR